MQFYVENMLKVLKVLKTRLPRASVGFVKSHK
nr:MAG TPA: hypothetical protein [Microviridae sp.]